MAFLSWLMSLGHGLSDIAQEMVALGDAATLAQLYAGLASDAASNAWPNFQAAIQSVVPIANDDPFGAMVQPAQLAHLAPWTVEMAGKVFAAILADVAAGKSEHQIVASVRAALVSAPTGKPKVVPLAACRTRSHRLVPPGASPLMSGTGNRP
jgi:hypothetical protein